MKTNGARFLENLGIAFELREYEVDPEDLSATTVAKKIGMPKATRAVARACATNPVAVAIPCHRVIREDGDMGGYRWGLERKEQLLALEKQAGS